MSKNLELASTPLRMSASRKTYNLPGIDKNTHILFSSF